jgi:signal transduction histidine kinase
MPEQLVHRERLASLGRLVAGVAHEIRNPLAAVTGMLDLMKEIMGEKDHLAPEDVRILRDLVLDCEGAADRMGQLVVSLKDMGRAGDGAVSLFDPTRAIRDAVRLFAAAQRDHCRVDLSVSALPAVRGSAARLGQVIVNLLQNGLDASGDGSTLAVCSDSREGQVRISVRDSGPGIPPHVAQRIFEPFFTSKGAEGLGLGLSICRDIVREMGGAIDFETGPGGTTFRVMLSGHPPSHAGRAA